MNDASTIGSDHPPPNSDLTFSGHDDIPAALTADTSSPLQVEKRAQRDQKAAMLDHLIRDIDIVIYAQISVLYYMDCSLLYFLVRAFPHWILFTPKPSIFPPTPGNRPYFGFIFGFTALCIFFHTVFTLPATGEATRGYSHGGLLIDFVGQKGPVGRWKMIGFDFLIMALQILLLGVIIERRATVSNEASSGNGEEMVEEQRQDHDSEERGILRHPNQDRYGGEDIEMEELGHLSQQTNGIGAEAHYRHPLDTHYTGEYIIANLHLVDTLRAQWHGGGGSAENGNASTSGVQAAIVAAAAGRNLTFRLNEGMQDRQ